MSKATHIGECQLCGRTQKLPGGFLSQHGYAVKWQQFHGVCRGAHLLPYEQSCSAIVSELPWVDDRIKGLKKRVSDIRERGGVVGWFRTYGRQNEWDRSSSYYWVEVEFVRSSTGHGFGVRFPDGREDFRTCLPFDLKTAEEQARTSDARYIRETLEPEIAHYASYRKWCEDRISNWMEKPLTPVPKKCVAHA
jgi:hypothetical protein